MAVEVSQPGRVRTATSSRWSVDGLVAAVPLISAIGAVVGMLLYLSGDERALFLALGFLPLAAVSLPLMWSEHRELGMWALAILSILIGYTIRLWYVYRNNPSPELIDGFFLLGEPPQYFVYPTLLISAGLVLMAASYIAASGRVRLAATDITILKIRRVRLYAVTGFFALLSLVSFLLFVQGTGGFDATSLSTKRTSLTTLELANDQSFRSFGELRYFSSLGVVGYIFLLVALLSQGRRLRRSEVAIAVFFLGINLLLPFYSSNRSDAVVPILATVVVLARHGRKLNWRTVLVPALALLIIFNAMTDLRSDDSLSPGSIVGVTAVTSFADSTAVSRSFADFSKTSHLVQRVPEVLNWRYGSTIAAFVVAPIPRSIWPAKPLISSGPIIGQQIYEQRRAFGLSTSGVPPGFFGEMYWNFGPAGVIFGSPLLGWMLGMANRWSKTRRDIRAQVFFGAGLFSIVSGFLAVGVGFSFLELATTWVGVQVIYLMLGRPGLVRPETAL